LRDANPAVVIGSFRKSVFNPPSKVFDTADRNRDNRSDPDFCLPQLPRRNSNSIANGSNASTEICDPNDPLRITTFSDPNEEENRFEAHSPTSEVIEEYGVELQAQAQFSYAIAKEVVGSREYWLTGVGARLCVDRSFSPAI
jgi:hypothetical protein